ncbi:MAG: Yip1 family protein [Halococcoides sp.]
MVPPIDVLLFDPESFFEREEWGGWASPAAVIGLLLAVLLLTLYPTYQMTQQLLGEMSGGSGFALLSVGFTAGWFIVTVPLYWLLVAGSAYGVGVWFDGDADFSTIAQAVAWGFVPHVVGALVTVAGSYLRYLQTEIPAVTEDMTQQEIQALSAQISGVPTDPVNLIITVVGLATLFWGAYLWTVGVETVHGIERRHAAIVAVPWIVVSLIGLAVNFVGQMA